MREQKHSNQKQGGQEREPSRHAILIIDPDSSDSASIISLLACDTFSSSLPTQCAWCGKVSHDRMESITLLQQTKMGIRPYLHPKCSHGICRSCVEKHMPVKYRPHAGNKPGTGGVSRSSGYQQEGSERGGIADMHTGNGCALVA